MTKTRVLRITTPVVRVSIRHSPSRVATHPPLLPRSPNSSPTMRRNITLLGRLSRMITATSPTMALRKTRIRPLMRHTRSLPSRLNRLHLRYASMKRMKAPALSSTSLRPLKSRNRSQIHTLALSSNSSRRSRSWDSAATYMRRSQLRSSLLEQVETLMYLPMTIATPISRRRTLTRHPMIKQRRNKIPPPALQQQFPQVPMPSSVT